MRIVPAIDIQQGEVVRAVAGERLAYLPLKSKLAHSTCPEDIGRELIKQHGLSLVYLADLDAISGQPPNWELYQRLIDSGLSLWIDAGLVAAEGCHKMVQFAAEHAEVQGIIAGMESVADRATFNRFQDLIDPNLMIFSLDLKDGHPLTKDPAWQKQIALEIAIAVAQQGVERMIVIDLARVGMHGGSGTRRLCTQLHTKFPELALYAGGGVRSVDDLVSMAGWGCSAALVSSALHDGWITSDELKKFQQKNANR